MPNVLAAISIGKFFGVPDRSIKDAIEAYAPSNSRSQLIEKNSNKIILDAYNANPSSMRSAIENFAQLNSSNKVLILGAMAELGVESVEEHRSLIELIARYTWKNVVLVGGDFLNVPHGFLSFKDATEAGNWYNQQHFRNSLVLIKGSRSMEMEKVFAQA